MRKWSNQWHAARSSEGFGASEAKEGLDR